MTTATLYETIQRIVQEELQRQQTAALATVQKSHPHGSDGDTDNYACSVVLRDTGLVLNQVPVATSRVGHVSIPHPGDLVLVQFVGGDLNAPVITGSFYTDQARPSVSQEQQALWQLPADADAGSAVRFQLNGAGPQEIQLQVGDACVVKLVDDTTVVSVDVDGGQAVVQIDRNGDIKVTSNTNLELNANAITVKAQSDLTLEAGGNLKIKGGMVNIN